MFVNNLETFLGKAIDDDILSIMKSSSLKESVERNNKFCPPLGWEMSEVSRKNLLCH
jgi:hypothetical protein